MAIRKTKGGGKMTEVTVVAKDRVGLLADISEALGKKGVNIESVSVEASGRTAIVHLGLGERADARDILTEQGFRVTDRSELLVKLADRPGELAKVSRKLADKKISIRRVFILDADKNQKILSVETSDNTAAKKVLKDYL